MHFNSLYNRCTKRWQQWLWWQLWQLDNAY